MVGYDLSSLAIKIQKIKLYCCFRTVSDSSQTKPNDLKVLYGIAEAFVGLNNLKSALKAYKSILGRNLMKIMLKMEGSVLVAIARKLLDDNDLEEALVYYQKALDINLIIKKLYQGKLWY